MSSLRTEKKLALAAIDYAGKTTEELKSLCQQGFKEWNAWTLF